MDEPREQYTKRNKPVTERQILHDSVYMSYLKQIQRISEWSSRYQGQGEADDCGVAHQQAESFF